MNKFVRFLTNNPVIPVFGLFVLLHLVFLNINGAEWGDSYRILRASQYVRDFSYPDDEKRPPLFSALLAVRPESVDPVLWGRIFMLVISLASFGLFHALTKVYLTNKSSRILALVFFAFNPVYFYWSLRIYADVPFVFLVMAVFYLYKKWEENLSAGKLFALSFVSALAVLTRFEGYILVGAVGLGFLLNKQWKAALFYGTAVLVFLAPYLIYRNPLTSSYLSEPGGRTYDLVMVLTYIASLTFIFGFTSALLFIGRAYRKAWIFLSENRALGIYLLIELILILMWPAAVPRLFVAVLPFFALILGFSFRDFYINPPIGAEKWRFLACVAASVVFYVFLQYMLKLQFLIVLKPVFGFIVFLQLGMLASLYLDRLKLFFAMAVVSMLIWTTAVIWTHKDIYRSIKEASEYVYKNLDGDVYFNDKHAISDWYLNELEQDDAVTGSYCSIESGPGCLKEPDYKDNKKDYFIITNEHDPIISREITENPAFTKIEEFEYTIGRHKFFTVIVEAKKVR